MPVALRYVKLMLVPMLLILSIHSPAAAQFDVEPDWGESPFQEAMRKGSWAFDQWNLDEAEEQFRKALQHAADEPEDQRVYAQAYTRVYLSRVLDALHREDEALELHEMAMDTMLAPDTRIDEEDRADMLREHASLQTQLALWDEAEESLDRSFKHAQQWYGEDNPWALSYLAPKAAVYMQTQRQDEAIDIHRRSVEAYEKSYGRLNPGMLNVLGTAAFDAALAGEDELALDWFQWMLQIESNQYHHSDLQLFPRRHWVANHAALAGDHDLAFEQFYKVTETLEAALGDASPNVASMYRSIANVKLTSGDPAGGLEAIDEGLDILDGAESEPRLWIDLMMYRVNLLRMLDRDDEADEEFQRLQTVIDHE